MGRQGKQERSDLGKKNHEGDEREASRECGVNMKGRGYADDADEEAGTSVHPGRVKIPLLSAGETRAF